MNLRCMYCQTMFGVSRETMLIGLQMMESENLTHYDVYCPKCRRANRVERKKLELANPNWQEALKVMAKEAAKAEKERAATEAAKSTAASKTTAKETASKTAVKPKGSAGKKPAATKAPAQKTPPRAKGK
jgi:hypothetical protein